MNNIALNIKLRSVKKKDFDFILKIRNEEETRQACHDTSVISTEIHQNYMEKISNDKNCFQWIITLDKLDIGHVKIINEEFGYMIKKEYRGKGIGSKTFELVCKQAEKMGMKKLYVTIKINQSIPLKIALKIGFEQKKIISKDNKPYCYYLEKLL